MARKLDMVRDIYGNRETLKLAVRIIDLWIVGNKKFYGSKGHMKMILMDQKATYLVKGSFFLHELNSKTKALVKSFSTFSYKSLQ